MMRDDRERLASRPPTPWSSSASSKSCRT